MTTLTLPTCTLTIHDSPRTLPESRRTEHDYYALLESGVGSSLDDIDRHFETMVGLIGSDEPDAQLTAINNCRLLFNKILERDYSPYSLAFSCLIDSVNGEPWADYSPEGLARLDKHLSALKLASADIYEAWQASKKNSTPN